MQNHYNVCIYIQTCTDLYLVPFVRVEWKSQEGKGRERYTARETEHVKGFPEPRDEAYVQYTQICTRNGNFCFPIFNFSNLIIYEFDEVNRRKLCHYCLKFINIYEIYINISGVGYSPYPSPLLRPQARNERISNVCCRVVALQ